MSNVVSISVEKRESLGTGNSRRLRRSGQVPAILYGRGVESIALSVHESNISKLLGHTGMVELDSYFTGKRTAILKELQHNPINSKVTHIDFQSINANEVIAVRVPVISFGEPAGLKKGGQLEQVMREIEIECLPASMPEVIKVDVSALDMDQAFHIGDLKLADGLKALGDSDLVLFHVRAPRTTVEEAPAAAVAEGEAAEAAAAPAAAAADESAKKKA